MKADARRIRAAMAGPSDVRLFLLHGPDAAGAAQLVQLLTRALGADVDRVDLDGAALARDPARLSDEAAALSLFGGPRLIRVSGAGDESIAAIEALLAAPTVAHPVVAIAPAARTTSRLVKLAIAAPLALAHGCYEPSAQDAERIAAELAREAGLQPQPGVARRLAAATGNDRAVMAREIEKLALYCDASPSSPQSLDHMALDAVGADLDDSEAARLVATVIDGRGAELGTEIAAFNAGGGSPVTWLRALARRLVALAEMRAEVSAGQGPDAAMKRHRISFRDEAATRQALARWSPEMLNDALTLTAAAERDATRAGTAGAVVAEQAVMTLARRVGRR